MSDKPTFVIEQTFGDEGPQVFKVNGVEVGRCDHDSHGWEGMASQRDMFRGIARELGVRVRTKEVES